MRWLLIIATYFAVMPVWAYEQTVDAPESPQLRVVVGPEAALTTNGYVDGQLVLRVQLVSRYPFEALDFDLPAIANAEIIELLRPRTRKVSTYAGEGYIFETAIAIIPRESGTLTIPAIHASGIIEPRKDEALSFDTATDPTHIEIAGIAETYDAHGDNPWWLVSHRVEIDEEWSTPIEQIRAGEIIQRTVSVRVWGTTAERLPEIEHPRTRGVRVTLASSNVRTERSSDGLIAMARYVWNLAAEPQDVAFIAPVGVTFWHPLEHEQQKAGVPGHRLEPLPADSGAIAERLMQDALSRRRDDRMAAYALAAVFVLPLALLAGAFLRAWLPSRADLRLRRACHQGMSQQALYSATERWLQETGQTKESLDAAGDAFRRLRSHLFAPDRAETPNPAGLVREAMLASRKPRVARFLDRLRIL